MAVKADAAAQAQKLLFEAAFPPAELLSMLDFFHVPAEELSEVDTRPVLRVEVRGTAGQVHVKILGRCLGGFGDGKWLSVSMCFMSFCKRALHKPLGNASK